MNSFKLDTLLMFHSCESGVLNPGLLLPLSLSLQTLFFKSGTCHEQELIQQAFQSCSQ